MHSSNKVGKVWACFSCADIQRLQLGDRRDAVLLAPGEEFLHGARIGAPRVRIPVRREEFKEAIGRALADGGDEGRGGSCARAPLL